MAQTKMKYVLACVVCIVTFHVTSSKPYQCPRNNPSDFFKSEQDVFFESGKKLESKDYFNDPPIFPFPGLCSHPEFIQQNAANNEYCSIGWGLNDICWKQANSLEMIKCEHKTQLQALFQDCHPMQAENMNEICNRKMEVNLKEFRSHSRMVNDASQVETRFLDSIPGIHLSTRCLNCGYRNHTLYLFDPMTSLRRHWFDFGSPGNANIVGVSRWSSFVDASGLTSKTKASILTDGDGAQCTYEISNPVFVFDLIAWQVGHLIIDVLEPLHYMMIKYYGKINREAILFIDTADKKNMKQVIFSALARDVYHRDTLFKLLRVYTRYSIHSKRSLDIMQSNGICFKDLHLQLDISGTFSVRQREPPFSPLRRTKYQNFQNHILDSLLPGLYNASSSAAEKKPKALNVAFIQRNGSRVLKNTEELYDVVVEELPNAVIHKLVLESMDFTSQVNIFQDIDILVSQQGTGFHNVLFMRPNSVVILLMQPGWCRWHWQFSDQAILLGIRVVVYCHPSNKRFDPEALKDLGRYNIEELKENEVIRWHRKGWLQGPWYLKSVDTYLPIDMFRKTLHKALEFSNVAETLAPFQLYPIYGVSSNSVLNSQRKGLNIGDIHPFVSFKDVLEHTNGELTIRLIPEILFANNRTFENREELDELVSFELCFRDVNTNLPQESCFDASSFNEFGTLNIGLTTEIGPEYVIFLAWMQQKHGGKQGPTTYILIPKDPIYFDRIMLLKGRTLAFRLIIDKEYILFHIPFGNDPWASTQMVLSQRCRDFSLNEANCIRLHFHAWYEMTMEMKAAEADLPVKQGIPTVERPFVFLHLEKTGGTCMGNLLARSLSKWIGIVPCHGGIDCHTFNLEKASNLPTETARFIGGHFNWGFWQIINRTQISCFTMTRHPVSRIISYYYERIYGTTKRELNHLNHSELEFFLENWKGSSRGRWRDEGISNAACKMFSGAKIHSGVLPGMEKSMPEWSFEIAAERQSKCVIGVLEYWDESMKMLSTWFPWLTESINKGCPETTKGSNKRTWIVETIDTLRKDLVEIILLHNKCDMSLYEEAIKLFNKQNYVISNK